MLLELSHTVEQIIARNAKMMSVPPAVYIERLVLADELNDEQDMELSRFAERIKGCETRELALANGVEVPRCDTAQDFLAWLMDRSRQCNKVYGND